MRQQIRIPKGSKRIRVVSVKRFDQIIAEQQLDLELFTQLLKILQLACNGNSNQSSALLGISRLTHRKWMEGHHPPIAQFFWPDVIGYAIERMLIEWRKSASVFIRSKAQEIQTLYNEAKKEGYLRALQPNSDSTKNATRYFLSLFTLYPEVSTRKLKRDGRYAMSTLRRIAIELQLDRRTVGFGADKETFYSLPEDTDNED